MVRFLTCNMENLLTCKMSAPVTGADIHDKRPTGAHCPGVCQVNRPRATKATAQNGSGPLWSIRDGRCGLLAHFFTLFFVVGPSCCCGPRNYCITATGDLSTMAGEWALFAAFDRRRPLLSKEGGSLFCILKFLSKSGIFLIIIVTRMNCK